MKINDKIKIEVNDENLGYFIIIYDSLTTKYYINSANLLREEIVFLLEVAKQNEIQDELMKLSISE